MGHLMIIYGVGAAGIFLVLMLMYRYALKNSELLQLNEIERFDTKASMIANLIMATVPLISVTVAIVFRNFVFAAMYAGFTYFLYPILMPVFGKYTQKKRKKLLESMPPLTEDAI